MIDLELDFVVKEYLGRLEDPIKDSLYMYVKDGAELTQITKVIVDLDKLKKTLHIDALLKWSIDLENFRDSSRWNALGSSHNDIIHLRKLAETLNELKRGKKNE